MDREEITNVLQEVSEALDSLKVSARIYIVGGAAMVLGFNFRFTTADVDADFYPTELVRDVAQRIALRRGLPENWLSDSARMFIPVFKDPEWRPVFKVGNVELAVTDERTMLAMKMRASRGSRDIEDIKLLLGKCHIESEIDALALYQEYFPEDPLPPRAGPLLRSALSSGSRT